MHGKLELLAVVPQRRNPPTAWYAVLVGMTQAQMSFVTEGIALRRVLPWVLPRSLLKLRQLRERHGRGLVGMIGLRSERLRFALR